MDLVGAFRRFISGGKDTSSWREQGTARPLAELEREHGGPTAAAKAAGVSRATWWRWKKRGQKPSDQSKRKVVAAVRRDRVDPGRRALVEGASDPSAPDAGGLRVSGTFTISADTRGRSINFGPHPLASDVLDAYERGDNEGVRAGLSDLMSDVIGSPVGVEDPVITFY